MVAGVDHFVHLLEQFVGVFSGGDDAFDAAVADQQRGVLEFGVRIVLCGDAAGAVDQQGGHGLVLGKGVKQVAAESPGPA
jgi:2-polyprenyl-6-methoxyphenol hydroxylase-like FAD-dependent oxidoreductase